MCYLIAKDTRKHEGCLALKTRFGERLSAFVRELDLKVADKGIQLVTISRPTAFGEYAPYRFAYSEEEFAKEVTSW